MNCLDAKNLSYTRIFRCLGSTQHLKNKYGGGYVLELKCRAGQSGQAGRGQEFDRPSSHEDVWEVLHAKISDLFGEDALTLEESFADRRTYAIPQSAVTSLGTVFGALEKCE